MLILPDFEDVVPADRQRPARLVVVFLANFVPLANRGVEVWHGRCSDAWSLMVRSLPPGAVAGKLYGVCTAAVLWPDASTDEVHGWLQQLVVAGHANRGQGGEPEPLEFAWGSSVLDADGDVAESVQAAVREADRDQARFPAEWRYPTVLSED